MPALGLSLLFLVFLAVVGRALLAACGWRGGVLRAWLLAPSVGLALLVLALMVLNQIGWPIKSIAWPLTLGMTGSTAILWYWRRPKIPVRALIPFLMVAAISLIWTGWPALEFGSNWLSYVNDDFANYCLGADRFKDFGFYRVPEMGELVGRDYSQYFWFMHVSALMRFGSEHVLAWFSTLTGQKTLNVFMPLILGLSITQLFATAGLVLHAGRWRKHALLAVAFLAASPLFMLGTLYQLIAQVGGLALVLAVIAVATTRSIGRTRRRILPHVIILSLLSAALCVYYPEVIPFAILGTAFYMSVEWARQRAFPKARLGLALYGIIGTVLLLEHNVLSLLITTIIQSATGLRQIDLSVSLFPYFMIPSGLANLFGLMPLSHNFPEPIASATILLGIAGVLLTTTIALRDCIRPLPAACLLVVQIALGLRLFFNGNDFGLFKLAMFMQPCLVAMLAGAVLKLPRMRWTAPTAVGLFALLCIPTALYYTRASRGFTAGNFTEVKLASHLGTDRPALPPNTRLLCDINNLVAAKIAALQFRGTDLRFLSRDYETAPLDFGRFGEAVCAMTRLHPYYDELAQTPAMIAKRDKQTSHAEKQFLTNFRAPALDFDNTSSSDTYLSLSPQLGLFNRFNTPPQAQAENFFQLTPSEQVGNRVIFVHSGRGNHYYLGDRRRIGLYQQEADPFSKKTDVTGVGRFLLLRIEHPSKPFYLHIAVSKTLMGQGRTGWSPRGKILASTDVPLGFTGHGAVNRIIGPLQPVWINNAAYVALDFGEVATHFPSHREGLQALYNNNILLDSRLLVAFGRDISGLSQTDVDGLARPTVLAHFPEDIVEAHGLEFSGIYEDGWLSPESEFVLGTGTQGSCVHIKGVIPAIPNTDMGKGDLTVNINGHEFRMPAAAGEFDWLLPMVSQPKTTHIKLSFTASVQLPGGDNRPVGAKLARLEIVPPAPSCSLDYATPGKPRFASLHLDQDGWAQNAATISLPATTQSSRIELVVEYPGWTGTNESTLNIVLGGAPAMPYTLKPGQNTISLPLSPSPIARDMRIEAPRTFRLPSPDNRERAYRLLSLSIVPDPNH